jgi:hypothetical protein
MRTFKLLPLGFLEQSEEIGRRRFGELVGALSPQLSNEAGRIGNECRFALVAAVRNGREEGRIRFDQHLV